MNPKSITGPMCLQYALVTLFISYAVSPLCLRVPRPLFDGIGYLFSWSVGTVERVFLPFAALLNFAVSLWLRYLYFGFFSRRNIERLREEEETRWRGRIVQLILPGELVRQLLYFINGGVLFQASTIILEASVVRSILARWLSPLGMGTLLYPVATVLAYCLYLALFLLTLLPAAERRFRNAEVEYDDLVRF